MIHIDGIIYSLQKFGGITVYFNELISTLVRHEFDFAVSLEFPLLQSLNLKEGSFRSRKARRLERYRSCRILPEVVTDIFHSTYYRTSDCPATPTVVTVHDFVYERYAKGPKRWAHLHQKHAAIRSAEAVICISEATRQDLQEFVGEIAGQRVYVIHNGVSDAFHQLPVKPPSSPFILFVGERGGYKNFDRLLAAMEFLPELELHCVGGGVLGEEEFSGIPANVRGRVKHLGFVSEQDLNLCYNKALCLVYPSSYEGFGIPVVEAMKAGCPVVSINCAAVLEVGMDALVVAEYADPNAIADAVKVALSSKRSEIVVRGLEVASAYSWEKTHRKTLEVYRELSKC